MSAATVRLKQDVYAYETFLLNAHLFLFSLSFSLSVSLSISTRWPPALVTAAPVRTTVPPRAGSTLAKSNTLFHLRLCRHLRPVVTSGHWKVGRTIERLRLHRAITFRPLAASVTIVALVCTTPITTTAAAATRTQTRSSTNTVSL